MSGEFDIIRRYFAPLSPDGLVNDGAVLQIPEGHELVVSSDTLNAGTHFFEDAAPGDIAHKALAVNLSDLASMGARPLAYQLNIAFPNPPDASWLAAFTSALAECQKRYGITCSGGDTTSIHGALSIAITAMGSVPAGRAASRSGAKAGDLLMLSGCVGDAWLGYRALRDGWDFEGAADCVSAYYRPQINFDLAQVVQKHACAAIDVSDGLAADIGHIAGASGVDIALRAEDIPLSDAARAALDKGLCTLGDLITGGDDYVLAMAVNPNDMERFSGCYVIGECRAPLSADNPAIAVIGENGQELSLKSRGWQHF